MFFKTKTINFKPEMEVLSNGFAPFPNDTFGKPLTCGILFRLWVTYNERESPKKVGFL